MFTATRDDGMKVSPHDVTHFDGPFRCDGCGDEVILKHGRRVTAHFAHKSGAECALTAGETREHLRIKEEVFRYLKSSPHTSSVEMERNLGAVRPDVSGRIHGHRVAVEVQRSNLSEELIAYRTACYAEKGIAVVWLLTEKTDDWRDPTAPADRRCSPRPWHLWLHAAFFGRVYAWGGGKVIPVHFDDFWLYRDGREGFGGDVSYRSTRWRTPVFGRSLSLTADFGARRRPAWSGGKIDVPECLLWTDNLFPWWSKR